MRNTLLLSEENIHNKILILRNRKVMIDSDLADFYLVKTKVLLQAVKRNPERFPDDFMFQLSDEEYKNLRSQIVTSRWGGRRFTPYAFTEQGISMLSSVLKSRRAILINIQIMRIFTSLKQNHSNQKQIIEKINFIEKRVDKHDKELQSVLEAIKKLINAGKEEKKKVGFV